MADPITARPSLLEQLKVRREAILSELTLDIPIPGIREHLGGEIVLRVKPVGHDVISRQLARREKAKTPEARAEVDLAANATIIAAGLAQDGCGFVCNPGTEDEELYSVKEASDLFLPDAEKPSGADTVRAIFLKQADALMVGGKVMKHSGYADAEADEGFAGES